MKNKNYILIIFISLIILFSFNVIADSQNFSLINSYNWINFSLHDKSWSGSVDEISLGILALRTGSYNSQLGINKLKSLQFSDGSWNDNIYDTSWATYALFKTGNDYNSSLNWLLSKQVQASSEGNWYIQIKTPYSGTCSVSQGSNNPIEFEIQNGSLVNCNANSANSWIDLQYCAGFVIGINETVNVDCNNLGNADISLLYKQDNNYYILDAKSNTRFATFLIDNGYFGDYESTAYATWILSEMNQKNQLHTIPYLKSHPRSDDNANFDRALLLAITGDKNYADYLSNSQNNLTGFWDSGNIYNSAFIIYSLKKQFSSSIALNPGLTWLQGEQDTSEGPNKGSWDNGDIRSTAMSIYSIKGGITLKENIQSNKTNNSNNTTKNSCTLDSDCGNITLYDCISGKCELKDGKCNVDIDCSDEEYCDINTHICKQQQKPLIGCTSDSSCKPGQQCSNGVCGDIPGWCDSDIMCSNGEKCNLKTNFCEKKSSPLWWIITLLVIAILGGIFFFIKSKGGIKLKNKPNTLPKQQFPQTQSPFINRPQNIPPKRIIPLPQKNYVDDQLEKDLDSSIKKAKELMGKK